MSMYMFKKTFAESASCMRQLAGTNKKYRRAHAAPLARLISGARSLLKKTTFDAVHDILQMWLGNLVKDLAAFAFAGKESTTLHQPKMLRSHVVRDITVLGKFPHGVPSMEQKLDHSQANRVSQRLQAFRRFRKRLRTTDRFRF
jgi:hypothetical protein